MKNSPLVLIGSLTAVAALVIVGGEWLNGGGRGKSRPDVTSSADGKRPASAFRVGLVFDIGGLGDKSFNDAAYRGLLRAEKELGVQTLYIEPNDGSDRESSLRQLAARRFDLIIGVGLLFSDDVTKLAKTFPDVKFGCIDYVLPPGQKDTPENLVGLRFREHEGSFLVGAVAGRVSETGKVGFVGGMKMPLIRKFEIGYTAGVKHVCPDCTVLSAYAGTDGSAFNDPITGQELAITQYSRGADIIFHASGKTGDGVFNAARQKKKMAIGVDSDQYPFAPCCVLTSMIKRVDVAVFKTIESLVNGEFEGGVKEFGLIDDGVGFVYDDNNKDRLPKAVKDAVDALAEKIRRGELTVPYK